MIVELHFDEAKRVPLALRDKVSSACGYWGATWLPLGDNGIRLRLHDDQGKALAHAYRLCDVWRVAYQTAYK